MGVKLKREKSRNFWLSLLYRIHRILPISVEKKLSLYLDMEWIFDRLAHETSFKVFSEKEHPIRIHTIEYLQTKISAEHKVLDLGCKYGEITYAISEMAHEVIGIDYSATSIQIAKDKHKNDNLTFVVADAIDYLKAAENKFDVLVMSHILEHIDDPEKFLSDFVPFFKFVYIELPDFNKTYLNEYRKLTKQKLIYTDTDHVSEFDRHELKAVIDSAGLKIEEAEYAFGIQKVWCKNKLHT